MLIVIVFTKNFLECCYDELVILSGITVIAVMLSVILPSVVMLRGIILNVIMVNVVAAEFLYV